eukprot:496827-Rhodomonas_salina.1
MHHVTQSPYTFNLYQTRNALWELWAHCDTCLKKLTHRVPCTPVLCEINRVSRSRTTCATSVPRAPLLAVACTQCVHTVCAHSVCTRRPSFASGPSHSTALHRTARLRLCPALAHVVVTWPACVSSRTVNRSQRPRLVPSASSSVHPLPLLLLLLLLLLTQTAPPAPRSPAAPPAPRASTHSSRPKRRRYTRAGAVTARPFPPRARAPPRASSPETARVARTSPTAPPRSSTRRPGRCTPPGKVTDRADDVT